MFKKILSLTLILMLVLTLSTQSIFAQGKGRPNKGNSEDKKTEEMKDEEENKFETSDLSYHLKEMLAYGQEAWTKLPYGLSKKDTLPPGLEKLRLENRLPYGLAKRLEGYEQPKDDPDKTLEMFVKLIDRAELLLENEEDIIYTEAGLINFKASLIVAKDILQAYDTSEDVDLLLAINDLKEAMATFKLQELVGDEAYEKLTSLYEALTVYGDLYFENPEQIHEDDVFYNAYKSLMASLEDVLSEDSEVILTKEYFNQLIESSKVFKNHKTSLEASLTDAKTLLFVDIDADVMVYKYLEGTDPGQILSGSNLALYQAITQAEVALEDLDVYDYQGLKLQKDLLLEAMETFKNNVFLGEPAIETLVAIEILLEAHSEVNDSDELTSLIEKIQVYTSETVENKYITKGDFNLILTQAQDYIDALFDGMQEALDTFMNEKEVVLALVDLTLLEDSKLEAYNQAVKDAQAYILDKEAWTLNGFEETYDLLKTQWQVILDDASRILKEKVEEIALEIVNADVEALETLIETINLYLSEEHKGNLSLEGINNHYTNLLDLYEDYQASLELETQGQ